MTIHLECASPRTSCNLPGRQAGKAPMPFGIMSPLFGLAPGGVCLAKACYQTRGALLPHLFTLTAPKAWRFVSVALSLRLPSPDVIRHLFPWSPDFPPLCVFRHCTRAAIQPTGRAGVRLGKVRGQLMSWSRPNSRSRSVGLVSCEARGR